MISPFTTFWLVSQNREICHLGHDAKRDISNTVGLLHFELYSGENQIRSKMGTCTELHVPHEMVMMVYSDAGCTLSRSTRCSATKSSRVHLFFFALSRK